MQSTTSALAASRVRQTVRAVRPVLSEEKKLVIAEWSRTSPARLGSESVDPTPVMIDATCLMAHRTATSLCPKPRAATERAV